MKFIFDLLGLSDLITPERVIFSGPATIVFWKNKNKTVVKCAEGEYYDKRTAILWAIVKNIFDNSSRVNKMLDKLIADAETAEKK